MSSTRLRPAVFKNRNKPVGTWVSLKDFETLQMLAKKNNVSMSLYLRAIIVDVLEEEQDNNNSLNALG